MKILFFQVILLDLKISPRHYYYYFKFRTIANTQQDTGKFKMDVQAACFIAQVSY